MKIWFQHFRQQYATAALVALALIGGLGWGLSIGREWGRAERLTAPPVATRPLAGEAAPVATPIETPVATIPLQFAPNASPEAQPRLNLALTIVDAQTGQPVTGAAIYAGGMKVIAGVSEFDLAIQTTVPGEKWVNLRIDALGYETWERDLHFKILHTRREPLRIEMEPLPPAKDGSGA